MLVVKDISINPTNRKELEVNQLRMVFKVSGWDRVGTTIYPNIPLGISKMFSLFIYYFVLFLFIF
jgi:hypothetical protein